MHNEFHLTSPPTPIEGGKITKEVLFSKRVRQENRVEGLKHGLISHKDTLAKCRHLEGWVAKYRGMGA